MPTVGRPTRPGPARSDTNPFVGPAPFERTEWHERHFFGRSGEVTELAAYVLSQPTTLVYAQSGAGKTSMVNAGVIPLLERRHRFQVLPVARVRGHDVAPTRGRSYYIEQVLLSLDPTRTPAEVAGRRLADHLSALERPGVDGHAVPRVLVVDQLEEVLALYSEDSFDQQEDFFRQVDEALAGDPLLRVLWMVREDQLPQLEPFEDLLAGGLGLRFRLERLTRGSALEAVTRPLDGTDRSFAPGVAEALVTELLKTNAEVRPGHFQLVPGRFVEPVQLQVVCQTLFERSGPGVITEQLLRERIGDIDQPLSAYYEWVVAAVTRDGSVDEELLRQWFDERLITPVGTRGTVLRGAETTDDLVPVPNAVVDQLERVHHIVRGERRAAGQWYELVHDTFIVPIREANARWRSAQVASSGRFLRTALPMALVSTAVSVAWALSWAPPCEDPAMTVCAGGEMKEPGQVDRHHFRLGEGAAATVQIEPPGVAVTARLEHPDGRTSELQDVDDGATFTALVPPASGRYTVLLTSGSPAAGSYELDVAVGTWIDDPAASENGTLSTGGTEGYLLPDSGDLVVFELASDAFDPVLDLYDAGGRLLGSDDDSGSTTLGSRLLTVLIPGTHHHLVVRGYDTRGGDFRLTGVVPEAVAVAAGQEISWSGEAVDDVHAFVLPAGVTELAVGASGMRDVTVTFFDAVTGVPEVYEETTELPAGAVIPVPPGSGPLVAVSAAGPDASFSLVAAPSPVAAAPAP